ncbi:MAG TPA: polysaccharide ABC transporter ATP-binding protein, partial [Pyrinomonadaceae bacterium]|nr:polysaccharide ABC transporter ATP-binding protein [Pyrinomonadaceae bacterium]
MPHVAIRCEKLGKQFRIGSPERYKTLRDAISTTALAPFKRSKNTPQNGNEYIWALKDVSFEIKRGEVVGIIGLNGAGKSTLLKILSRITAPTRGIAELYGRVGSLLEVGTGFHPELTGRENIYLNGAILGMRKAEIDRKFDEIVAFAEVEKFLDTPVKRYSTGMYVRLAFGVAAHLETELLLVDEVLAVGDAQFQKKCFQKMSEIGTEGRTILFVSHNMSAVRSICKQALIVEQGAIVAQGEINETVDRYLSRINTAQIRNETVETNTFSVTSVQVSSAVGPVIKTFDPVEVRVQFIPKTEIRDPGLYVSFLTMDSRRLTGLDLRDFITASPLPAGQIAELGFTIESLPLLPGVYQVEIHLKDKVRGLIEMVPRTFEFEIAETEIYGGRKLDAWFGNVGL